MFLLACTIETFALPAAYPLLPTAQVIQVCLELFEVTVVHPAHITQANSHFQAVVPASAFISQQFSDNFFKSTECFRWDQENCAKPGTTYYEVSRGF